MSDLSKQNPTFIFEGLRGVGNVELTLAENQRVYTFFGSNGIGKTKCLEALFQYYCSHHSLILNQLKNKLDNKPETVYLNASSSLSINNNLPLVFIESKKRSEVFDIENQVDEITSVGTFEKRQKKYIHDLIKGKFDSVSNWFITRARSSNPFEAKKDNRNIEIYSVLELLHQIENRFDSKFLKITADNSVFFKIAEEEKELNQLSSGFASLIKMIQRIIEGYGNFTNEVNLTHVRGVVFIDEIDAHLHLEWQVKIVPLLKKLFPNTTFYIATHSPLVLSQLKEGEAYLLKRDDDDIVRSEMISSPDTRIFADVLDDGFGINLNKIKRERILNETDNIDNTEVKQKLRDLLAHRQKVENENENKKQEV